jgi:pimeloyl-ACP methyl ester carboxylesterase
VRYVYLHGFASSPQSAKARFFAGRLAAHGLILECPDLNEPAFEDLTVSRMIAQVEERLTTPAPGPAALIGSSLGAFAALQLAARHPPVDRLVLLAPALDFEGNRRRHLGETGLARWRESDRLEVYHYGYREMRAVRYGLYEDARRYDCFALDVTVPILIFHGRHDAAIDPAAVQRFAESRPNVILRMLDDDHQLLRTLDEIWTATEEFLGLARR